MNHADVTVNEARSRIISAYHRYKVARMLKEESEQLWDKNSVALQQNSVVKYLSLSQVRYLQ